METEKNEKKIFFIIIGLLFVAAVFILVLEKGSKVLNQSSYQKIDKIVIKSEYSTIEVKYLEIEDVKLLVYGKSSDYLDIKSTNRTLTIEKDSKKGFCLFNCSDKIILYLPKEFEKIDITSEMGDINLEEVNFSDIYVKSGVGNINIADAKVVNIEANIGDVHIKKIEGEFDSYIVVNTGNVIINNTDKLNIKAEANTGKVNVKETKDQEYNLNIHVDIGDIKVR